MATDTKRSGQTSRAVLCSGTFHLRFGDERQAREAGRDAGACGFSTELRNEKAEGWALVVTRRSQPFPLDEQDRYSGRLRLIAAAHGGSFERFVQD